MPQSSPRNLPLTIATLVLCLVAFYLAFDYLVFRTGWYFDLAEPESTAGSVWRQQNIVARRLDPSRRNILVLGDSRVGEGFSAKFANQVASSPRHNFIGCGISGSTPRIWRYFLRWVDPDRQKFSAIVLMAAAYTDDETYEDLGNRSLDLNYCLPLLSYSDLVSFPAGFSDAKLRAQARLAVLSPLVFLQRDAKELVARPGARLQKVQLWRSGYPDWIYDYPGRPEALPNLVFDREPLRPREWTGTSAALKPQLQGYFTQLSGGFPPLPPGTVADYRRTWYGGIAADYAAAGVPVYVFLMPRGPYHAGLVGASPLSGTFARFSAEGTLRVIDPKTFCELEVPDNFFDQLHLNATGREKLTRRLVTAVLEEKP